jgi:hypothetical protein
MPGTPSDKARSRSGWKVKPWQPALGKDWDVQEAEAQTRGFLARLLASTTVGAIATAGIYSLIVGNYTSVIAAGPLLDLSSVRL